MPDEEVDVADKPMVWVDANGVANYRASAIYSCQNALLATRLGYGGRAAPPWMQKRYDAGHDHEPLILRKLAEKFGFKLWGQQEEVRLSVGSKAAILGHVDALGSADFGGYVWITHRNGRQVGDENDPYRLELDEDIATVVVDAKALSAGSTEVWLSGRWKRFPHYAWQQSSYEHGLAVGGKPVPLVMAVKNKNTDEMYVEWFDEPVIGRSELVRKVMLIEKLAEEGEPAMFRDKCEPKMWPCPFWDRHPTEANPTVDIDKEVVVVLAERREEVRKEVVALTAEQEGIEEQLRQMVGGKEARIVLKDDSDIISSVTTSHSSYPKIDWEQMVLDFPELDPEKYKVSGVSPKLTVRVNAKKATTTKAKGKVVDSADE